MFMYYLRLSWISIKRNPILSSLMVMAIALGIGASMTTITVNYLMSNNPIPHKSDRLFHVQIDTWGPFEAAREPNDPPLQLTWTDATYLSNAQQAYRQAAMQRSGGIIEPEDQDTKPFQSSFRLTDSDFFAMFDVPFLYGSGWSKEQDQSQALVAVLSRETNDKLFGGENSVGRTVKITGSQFQIVGVIDDWHPVPKFYDLNNNDFGGPEKIFMPFSLKRPLELPSWGNNNCWKSPEGDGFEGFLLSECVNVQYWVELEDASDKPDYMAFLDNYVEELKALGRHERPNMNRMSNVVEWMKYNEVVADDAQIMMWLSLMFLLVCLLNTIGLMLAKFMGKSGEIGLRRAVGATKGDLFKQHLIETGCIGLAGGLVGLAFAYFGLIGIRSLYGEFADRLTTLDLNMVVVAILLSLFATIIAGLYPTWRACSVMPAGQLKTQ